MKDIEQCAPNKDAEETMYKRIFYLGTYQPCNLTCEHDLSWFRTYTLTTREATK